MLLETQKLDGTRYALKCSLEGKQYTSALLNYPVYIDDLFCDSFENELFPEGKTPVAVNEELNGDELYRYIFKGHFVGLYQEATKAARLEDACLESVEIDYFSSERILFTLIVSTTENSASVDYSDPLVVLKRSFNDISNVEKLRIFPTEKRDASFWQNMQAYCKAYQQTISKEVIPILSKIGVINSHRNGIGVDLNSNNPMRSLYPMIELLFFPCAVLTAALYEYLGGLSAEDEKNIDKYIYSTVYEMIDTYAQASGNKKILLDRLQEYSCACRKEMFSGYSLYGQFGMDFDGLRDWSKNHKVKCAHLLCDHIAYIEHFGELCSYADLDKLRPIVVSNSSQKVALYAELFEKLHTTSGSIFMTVRSNLNGSTRLKWKAEGLCQHCGSEFKRSLFGTKCSNCKCAKDY